MLFGIDFDNTIVSYDTLFHSIAYEKGLIPQAVTPNKNGVRDYLRKNGNEDAWTELQGYVYGKRMHEASPFPGVAEFFHLAASRGHRICIISHKTRFPIKGPRYDLHHAARDWIQKHGFLQSNCAAGEEAIFFELTKEEKLARIRSTGCDVFIDDLLELLTEKDFPPEPRKILFDVHGMADVPRSITRVSSWSEAQNILIGVNR